TLIGPYRLLERLGGGGMGVVCKAHDTRLDRPVALKFLAPGRAADPQFLARFQREVRIASALNHPHICTIHDTGVHEAQPFLVMEFIAGQTVRALLGRRLAVPALAQLGRQVAQALAAAHAAGAVHRDLKPVHLMVRPDGQVRVLIFGRPRLSAAQAPAPAPTKPDTDPGTLVGTTLYMSPEQARAEPAGSASDVFALGIVLYELATGQHPFAAASAAGVLGAILTEPPVPASRLNPEVSAPLEGLLQQMLP